MVAAKLHSVNLSDEIRSDESLRRRVERASEILAGEIGQSSGIVDADWTVQPDEQGRPLVRLRISDFAGTASTSFAPDDFERETAVHRRSRRLWGDLLQDRFRHQFEEFREIVRQIEED